ncbi:MAG: hypothetical protein ACFCD0_09560 [Gemmataceae bacterium]
MHLTIGSKVFAVPNNEQSSYSGTIQELVLGRCCIEFDDGREEWVDSENVFARHLVAGQSVEVRFAEGHTHQLTRVLRAGPHGAVVRDANGKEKQVGFEQLRVPLEVSQDIVTGDRVWGQWTGDDYWYPGTIEGIVGDHFSVRFDDGGQDELQQERIKPFDLPVGLRVLAYPKSQGGWVPGEISSVEGERVRIRYDYGTVVSTSVANLKTDFGSPTWHPGDRVLAQWDPEPYCYVGTIREIQDDKITVEFDDGDKATVFGSQVFWLYFVQGQTIQASRDGDQRYEPAWVLQLQAEQLQVRFEDKTTAWLELKDVRISPDSIVNSG